MQGHCLVAGWRAGWYDLVTLLSQVFKNSTKPKEVNSLMVFSFTVRSHNACMHTGWLWGNKKEETKVA